MSTSQTVNNHITGQVISNFIEKQGNAAIEMAAGMDLLTEIAQKYAKVSTDKTQGRMFEIIETTKFNVSAAKAGSELRAIMTETLGMPHHEADIFIKNKLGSGDILRQIQAKSGKKASNLSFYIKNKKYNGMDRLVNSNHEKKVGELIDKRIQSNGINTEDYKDARKHLTGELKHGDIKSGGTTYKEAKNAAEDSNAYARKMKNQAFATGAKEAMIGGALAGAFTGLISSGVQGSFKGEFSVKETSKETLNQASRGAVVSGVAYGIKYVGKNNPIIKGNVAASLASSAVTMTETTYQFLKGNITIEQYVEEIGSNGVSCLSGIVMTAAGGALFGPVGAAVAGTVAVMGMQQLYKVFTQAQSDLQLAKEARSQAEELSKLLIEEIKNEEQLLISYYDEYALTLGSLRDTVNMAIENDEFTEAAILDITTQLNIELQYKSLDEFDNFMSTDESLIL